MYLASGIFEDCFAFNFKKEHFAAYPQSVSNAQVRDQARKILPYDDICLFIH